MFHFNIVYSLYTMLVYSLRTFSFVRISISQPNPSMGIPLYQRDGKHEVDVETVISWIHFKTLRENQIQPPGASDIATL